MMKMKTKAVLIVMAALIVICIFAPLVSAETAEEWNEEGVAFAMSGEYKKAIECFGKAIALDPIYVTAYENRRIAVARLGQNISQNIMMESSLKVDNEEYGISDSTETAQEWNERGISFGKAGEYKEAIECFDKAIALDPNFAPAYNSRGVAYEKLKKYEKAIEDYNKAIALDPNFAPAYYNRGIAHGKLKKYEKAIEDYNKAIALDPNYAKAYYNRGIAYEKLKEYERAIEDYNKAIALDPNYAYAYNNRGVAYGKLKEYERAIEDYNKAIALDPNYVKAYENRKIANARLGQNIGQNISQNILVESSLNYDVNLDGSARATIFIDIINTNKYGLWLKFIEFKIKDENRNITNVNVQVPYDRTFIERKGSYADCFKFLSPGDYCCDEQKKNGIWYKYFCVAINKMLPPNKVTHLYTSYSIDEFIKFSGNDTEFLHVPCQPFRNVKVFGCKWFSWYNVPGSDNANLLEILREDLNITWTEDATISKPNNDTIIISSKDEQHTAKIIMDWHRSTSTLEIRDGEIYDLKIRTVDGKKVLCLCYNPPTELESKDYNILINFPQDRYHYSKLLTVPHPHPDAIFMNGKSPSLSWHFTPKNRDVTHLLIPAYKIQKDYLMIALDTFVLLSIVLGFIGVILAVKEDKPKRRRLRIILVVIFVIVIGLYIGLTGLWTVYWELLLENLQKVLGL